MSIDTMNEKVRELRELRRMAEELQVKMDAITDSLKSHMDEQGVDTLTGADWKVTWKEVTTKRFDKAAMIDRFGQSCYDEFCKTITSRRFSVA